MTKFMPALAVAALMLPAAAFAETTTTMPSATSPSATSPSATSPSATMPSATMSAAPTLTDSEAKAWIGRAVYSNDNKRLGEVTFVQRDSSGAVSEIQADIGGFLGIGETRVRILPSEMKLGTDRVVLNLTSAQSKTLPKVQK